MSFGGMLTGGDEATEDNVETVDGMVTMQKEYKITDHVIEKTNDTDK